MQKTIKLGNHKVELIINKFAPQANGSVMVKMGNNLVLGTAVAGAQDPSRDYFPLSVDFIDKLYAGGQTKGGKWSKRDVGGSDDQILNSRIIDRSLRPLFPQGYCNEVQVISTCLSNDKNTDIIILGFLAASVAVSLSDIPFNGPVSAVRIGRSADKKLIVNPSLEELKNSDLDLLVCTSPAGVNMVEADGKMVDNDTMYQAIELAKTTSDEINAQITTLVSELGKPKASYIPMLPSEELKEAVLKSMGPEVDQFIQAGKDGAHVKGEEELLKQVKETFSEDVKSEKYTENQVVAALNSLIEEKLVDLGLKGMRYDKRAIDEIRPLSVETSILPETHGSALFQRGLTQALTNVTLSGLEERLYLQDSRGEHDKTYLHFYSAMPFSTGQVGKTGRPGRREVGHGALAEKALWAVLPTVETFPYNIIVNSEVLSQNGSSSMASTCGSTLALCDAGVPIIAKVAGISTGMVSKSDSEFVLLTDIAGIEDHCGDMDFKITGTRTGITAIQLDIKRPGLTLEMIRQTLDRSLKARLQVLDVMDKAIPAPRAELSKNAPKIVMLQLPEDKIGEVIGSGGKVVKGLAAKFGVTIDINDVGQASVISPDLSKVNACIENIKAMIKEPKVGEEYDGLVTRVENYGAFVEFLPGREALLHVSEMSMGFISDASKIIKIGDKLKVKISGFNDNRQIKLAAPEFKAAHPGESRPEAPRPKSPASAGIPGAQRHEFANFRPNLAARHPDRPSNRTSFRKPDDK